MIGLWNTIVTSKRAAKSAAKWNRGRINSWSYIVSWSAKEPLSRSVVMLIGRAVLICCVLLKRLLAVTIVPISCADVQLCAT